MGAIATKIKLAKEIDEAAFRNITLENQVSKAAFRLHNNERQLANTGKKSKSYEKVETGDFQFCYHNKTCGISYADAKALWLESSKMHQLEYKAYTIMDQENWYGTMGPYSSIFNLLNARFDELRNGYRIIVGKT